MRKVAARVGSGVEQLLREERIALRAGGDRVGHRRRQRGVRVLREERGQLVAFERPELELETRARAPDAVREAPHALGRRGLVGTVGGEQQDAPVGEVVREEDDEVERRCVRPVDVLEHEQHRRLGCAIADQRERLLEHPELRLSAPQLAQRLQRLDERLVGQLRADEVDRPPDQDFEAVVACTLRSLGRQSRFADARLPGDENGRSASGSGCLERVLQLVQLGFPSDEGCPGASRHRSSITPPRAYAYRWREISSPATKDKARCPMRSRSSTTTIGATRRRRGGET